MGYPYGVDECFSVVSAVNSDSEFMTQLDSSSQNSHKRDRQGAISSRVSPWLAAILYPLAHYIVLPLYFRCIDVTGQENLPQTGATIIAPTHRSRWDPILVAYLTGRRVTGRDPRFMTSANETEGIQGWIVRRLGAFPVDLQRVGVGSLRHGVELLVQKQMLVIFPEGNTFFIQRNIKKSHPDPDQIYSMKPGLGRLAIQAERQANLDIQVVPISLRYDTGTPRWRCQVSVRIGEPISVASYLKEGGSKQAAKALMNAIRGAASDLHQANHLESVEVSPSS